MFTIDKYVLAESLEQAYELNQNKRSVVLGGMLWLKMGKKRIGTAIDLSALNLNLIEEDDTSFKIGCMATLRDLEKHIGLNDYFNNLFSKSVENIVGVQMRNMATVGGSIYSRFGFSDILTVLLSLDSYVELYKGGIIPLNNYVDMPLDRDILVRIIVKKDERKAGYQHLRKSSSDFPVITCAVSHKNDDWFVVLGSRPMKATLSIHKLKKNPNEEEINTMIKKITENTQFGTNIRGSREYRKIIAGVLIRRNVEEIAQGGTYAN